MEILANIMPNRYVIDNLVKRRAELDYLNVQYNNININFIKTIITDMLVIDIIVEVQFSLRCDTNIHIVMIVVLIMCISIDNLYILYR